MRRWRRRACRAHRQSAVTGVPLLLHSLLLKKKNKKKRVFAVSGHLCIKVLEDYFTRCFLGVFFIDVWSLPVMHLLYNVTVFSQQRM